jgi:replicative DNA helicase
MGLYLQRVFWETLMTLLLSDNAAERAVLSGICRYGSHAYYDIADMVQVSTFSDDTNAIIYKCLDYILKTDDSTKLDLPSIYAAASHFKYPNLQKESDYLRALFDFPIELSNVRKFAAKIRKLQIAKLLLNQLRLAQDKVSKVDGSESITQILGIAEETVFDFTSLLSDNDEQPKIIGDGLVEYLEYLGENPVSQLGIKTGFDRYDKAIGGGLRRGTVNVIAARSKAGKTILSDNMGYHIAKNEHIPVLNMDTEMLKEDHIHRMTAMRSSVCIDDIETGQFAQFPSMKKKVIDAGKEISKHPYFFKSISGRAFEDQLAIMRRWVVKEVGLNTDGTAKDCVIIYDYLKLMDSKGISSDLKEYQVLGFMMTALHNFAVRYKLPILVLMQTNRDGLTKESVDTASGSDRIIWLCSNYTLYKKKSPEEIAEDGPEKGNRKLKVVVSRHGEGSDDNDYINCIFEGHYARITEGKSKLELDNQEKKGEFDSGNNDGKF